MKTVIRQAPILAGVLLAFVVFAFFDRIPDYPGEFKERRVQHGQSYKAFEPLGFDSRTATLVSRSAIFENALIHINSLGVERMAASAGTLDLRSAADSSPPALES